ncbi:MAG: MmcQ/YjbR family DNA-binding protein [Bacilli bacterium]|nr:MmcQ/YjbR family DNA-binding protein [Bacilli bacterium]
MIENNIFKRCHIDYSMLLKYGFIKDGGKYIYTKNIMNNKFKVIIEINNKDKIKGKIIDIELNEEYNNYRINNYIGEFASKIKEEYTELLIDIKNNCFIEDYFIYNQSNRITKYIIDKYNNKPEFLWEKFPNCGVFRNKNNNKWYGIIMNIDKSKLDKSNGEIEIINIKLPRDIINYLLKKEGYYKAYHMNKLDWISILLDDTLQDKEIIDLIDKSYNIVNNNHKIINTE